jgi:hypothetical protein
LQHPIGTSNVKNERTNVPISFWKRNQNVLVSFRICLVENKLFRFGPESALLNQIEMISFDGADSRTNSDVMVSFLLDVGTFVERDVGTFVERLFLYCFDIFS